MDANLALALIAPLGAGLAGVLAAGTSAPLAHGWPQPSFHPYVVRLAMLKREPLSSARRLLGSVILMSVLAGGVLAAYGAEPSAPEMLPRDVVGVVGSGDQLSLQVKAGGDPAIRTVKIGEEYKDGWTLQAVTPTKATLSKSGQTQEVGLSPNGDISPATPQGAPSTVSVVGLPTSAQIDSYLTSTGRGTPTEPRWGLDLSQYKRVQYYQAILDDYQRDHPGQPSPLTDQQLALSLYGQAVIDDYSALRQRIQSDADTQLASMTSADLQTAISQAASEVAYDQAQLAKTDSSDPQYAVWQHNIQFGQNQISQFQQRLGEAPQAGMP